MKDFRLVAIILSILVGYIAFYFVCYWIAEYYLRIYFL